ncbi:hypothetical protein [Spirillospora sp. CA-294931]|uniref:hypothetical protein n=1 Tax=Spirillospora sp. CA-294931 TaxID=3240042 RepID=UPI003D8DF729
MDPALAGLAGAAGAALVQAMATDFWGSTRTRFARIVGRGTPVIEEDLTRELEESAGRLNRDPFPRPTALAAEQEIWTALLTAFLAEHAEAAPELRDFETRLRRSLASEDAVQVVQNVQAGRDVFIAGGDQHFSLPVTDDER